MKFRKNIYALSIGAAMLSLSGCGITPQDDGLGASSAKPLSAVVVDGYLAGAVVFVDVNENNKLDAWETRALTDNDGYFSYNPTKTPAVNYCELAASDSRSIHCLKAPAGYDEVMVRMTGGYDLATVEPFTGTISMRMDVTSSVVTSPVAATPITGLLAEMTDVQRTAFFTDMGIDEADMTADFLDYSNSLTAAQRRDLLRTALKAHKVADVMATLLDPELDQTQSTDVGFFGVDEGIPADGSIYVYQALADSIDATDTLDVILADQAKTKALITAAVGKVDAVINAYNDRLEHDVDTGELTNPADAFITPTLGDAKLTEIADKVMKVAQVVENVFNTGVALDETDVASTQSDVISRIRAIDVVVTLTRNGEAATTIDKAVANSLDSATYLNDLRFAGVDMFHLKSEYVTQGAATPVGIAGQYSSRKTFDTLFTDNSSPFTATEAGGTVNDQGFGGNTLDLSKDDADPTAEAVTVAFVGETDADGNVDPSATSGTMTIAASALGGDYATEDGSDSEFSGTWEQVDEYTMIMNVEVTDGVFEPVIVKPNADGTGYYFDLDGEQAEWQ